jgi:transposase
MNPKLHVVCDSKGRPIQMYLSAGETSGYTNAKGLLTNLPRTKVLLADRGSDTEFVRKTLINNG